MCHSKEFLLWQSTLPKKRHGWKKYLPSLKKTSYSSERRLLSFIFMVCIILFLILSLAISLAAKPEHKLNTFLAIFSMFGIPILPAVYYELVSNNLNFNLKARRFISQKTETNIFLLIADNLPLIGYASLFLTIFIGEQFELSFIWCYIVFLLVLDIIIEKSIVVQEAYEYINFLNENHHASIEYHSGMTAESIDEVFSSTKKNSVYNR